LENLFHALFGAGICLSHEWQPTLKAVNLIRYGDSKRREEKTTKVEISSNMLNPFSQDKDQCSEYMHYWPWQERINLWNRILIDLRNHACLAGLKRLCRVGSHATKLAQVICQPIYLSVSFLSCALPQFSCFSSWILSTFVNFNLVNFFGQNQPNQGMLSLTSGHHTHTHTHTH